VTDNPLTYLGRPCRHCGNRERYRSNSTCTKASQHGRRWGTLARKRAAVRKQEFLR